MANAPQDGTGRPKTPRWVVVLAIAFALAVVVIVAAMLGGGGEHGPGRHLPGGSESHEAPTP